MRTLAIILACVVGPALIPIGIVVVMERRAEPLVQPPALVWGDRVFASKAQFSSWLEERGASYQEWVGRHPGASPWERRGALAARPGKPKLAAARSNAALAGRRAGEERSAGEQATSLLGRARGALVPAIVAAVGGLILAMLARSRRTIGGVAATWRATRFRRRLRGVTGALGGLALLAAKALALPGRLWAGARAGASRVLDQGPRPALAAGGAHRLSVAVEPAAADRSLPTGASGDGRRRHRPRRTAAEDERTRDVLRVALPVQPVERDSDAAGSGGAVNEVPEPADLELAPQASAVDSGRAVAAAMEVSEPVQASPVVLAEHAVEQLEGERATDRAVAASMRQSSERAAPERAAAAPAAVPPPAAVAVEQGPERAADAPCPHPVVPPVELEPAAAPVESTQPLAPRRRRRSLSRTRALERVGAVASKALLEPARVPAGQVAESVAPDRVPVVAPGVAPEPVAPQAVAPAVVLEPAPELVAPEALLEPVRVPAGQVAEAVAADCAPGVAPEPVAPQTVAPAGAAVQGQTPPDTLPLDDEAAICTIGVWHGYIRSRFYARVFTPDGETYTLAESAVFRRRGDIPEPLPDAVTAHEALLERLRAEGWRPVGSLGAWYASCLQPIVPAVVSISH